MAKVFGIDLGTTYSEIATLDENGMPKIIENQDEGTPMLASAVYFQTGGEPVVGGAAKNQYEVEPDRVVQYIKREIGKSDAKIREFDGKKYDPIDISSIILKHLKKYAEDQGYEVKDVVITCPAYFGNEEREATKQAGIIAGFNVLNIVNEPTAAALNYCCREFKENRKMMVYDLGGGTFDITLLDFSVDDDSNANIVIKDTGGDDRLGGIDWDARLFDYIRELYCDENGIAISDIDNELRAIIKMQVEGTKKLLSKKTSHSFNISYGGDVTRIEVTAEKFVELTQDLVTRTMDFVRQLLSNNSLSADDIDLVLLVGGSTLMPMIQTAVDELFPGKARLEEPHLAVAKGAALAAAIKWNEIIDMRVKGQSDKPITSQGNTDGGDALPPITEEEAAKLRINIPQQVSTVDDILSRSFGPAVFVDETSYMIDNLLFVGDEMPAEASERYGTMADNQAAVEIYVFENVAKDRVNKHVTPSLDKDGNEQYADPELKVKSLGKIRMELPPHTPKGTEIEVFFRCSAVGLEVRATNCSTNESVETVITSENIKTQEELNRAIEQISSVRTSGNI